MEEAAVETIYSCTYAKQQQQKKLHGSSMTAYVATLKVRFMLLFLFMTYVAEEILWKEVLYISSGYVVNCWKKCSFGSYQGHY